MSKKALITGVTGQIMKERKLKKQQKNQKIKNKENNLDLKKKN